MWHPVISVVVDYSTSLYYTAPILGVFGCSLYKSVLLQVIPWNALYPLMKPCDMFFWDRPATACPIWVKIVRLFFIEMSFWSHTLPDRCKGFTKSGCLECLPWNVERCLLWGLACDDLPCGRRLVRMFLVWGPRGHFDTCHHENAIDRVPLAKRCHQNAGRLLRMFEYNSAKQWDTHC